jgi:uncharacterized repeat protein (TIGR01451 family)
VSPTSQFPYNRDGVRTYKTVNGDTTEYVVDLAATQTPTATATATASPTVTATPTITPTATPAQAPAARAGELLDMHKLTDPSAVWPGDTITYTVALTNTGEEDLSSLVLVDSLPSEVTYPPQENEWRYSKNKHELT